MKVGVHIVNFSLPGGPATIGPSLAEIGRAAEEAGVTNVSVMDHYLQLGGRVGAADQPMLEGYTTLGYLAGITTTVELQLLVTGVTYRHPGLLAKIVSTLDVLSGGRAVLGIGAAWYEQEHVALGVPFPPLAERFERLEETLRLVAKYADATNLFAGPDAGPGVVKAKFDVLRRHCAREGTAYDRIRKTVLYVGPLKPDPTGGKGFAEQMARYADVGAQEVHVMPIGPDPVGFVRGLGDHVIPTVTSL